MILIPTDRPPTHPGEMLLEEFLKPLRLSQSELARRIHVSWPRVNELVRGRRPLTIDTAMRLGRFFGTGPELWLNLQLRWDLYHAVRARDAALERIEPLAPSPTRGNARTRAKASRRRSRAASSRGR